MRINRTQPGVAMVLVMILIAVAAVLGSSFLTSASIHVRISQNFQSLSRARYLAESGLEHGLYILRFSPEALEGSVSSPLGPFHVDDSPDSYTISAWEDDETPGLYMLTSTATVGDVKRTSSMTVYRTPGPTIKLNYGVLVGNVLVWLPLNLAIQGNVHVNGSLYNNAVINGNAGATQNLWDPLNRITGSTDAGAEAVTLPDISLNYYVNYRISMTDYEAVEFTGEDFNSNNPLADGGSVTQGNIGGVVYLKPTSGNTVRLNNDLNFTGTLIINGDLILNGQDITLTAVEGFPAIITTGQVKVTDSARNVTINGVVAAGQGIQASGIPSSSSTTVNGALISNACGYASELFGNHVLNYRQDRAVIYDFSQGPEGTKPQATVLSWGD